MKITQPEDAYTEGYDQAVEHCLKLLEIEVPKEETIKSIKLLKTEKSLSEDKD